MRLLAGSAIVLGFFAMTLFGAAGGLNLPFFWGYVCVVAATTITVCAVMDRDLMKERIKPGAGGTDRQLRLIATPFFLAHLIVAGLDVGRFHFSDTVPVWLRTVGLAGMAVFLALPLWAVSVNRFFSPVVRIQEERGHHLVTAGPYRVVRHPGYLGAIFAFPFGGMGLGSWLSLAPLAIPVLLILRRTIIEDRYLSKNLDGYQEYALRVRWRLVPGVW
ncbi:MAG: isoprenylcysteine carboxylmethyltransferase family protein [Planctomycetota bacterium]|nr:isoprenylcysteine carboxylmethyltransferase family protein [Planctomycetota bacterium]